MSFHLKSVVFVRNLRQLEKRLDEIKWRRCPHCGRLGTLNRHDKLYGKALDACGETVLRGQRVWCSRCGQRGGCGRTSALLFDWVLPGRSMTAPIVWSVLERLSRGKSVAQAHAEAGRALSLEALRAMLRRLRRAQAAIRAHLPGAPPPTTHADPLIQTAAHLRHAFPSEICPIGGFQRALQRPFPA